MGYHPRTLLQSYVEISSLPMIYNRISEVANDPRASMSSIGKVIAEDPGLTVRLLRLVNSAFYSFPSEIETITQALVIIGTQQLCDLALGTSVTTLFNGIPEDLVDMKSFWRHSVACGIAAKTIATYRREPNIERFFVMGMIHDIGRLVIYRKISDCGREVLLRCKSTGALMHLVEKELIGFDHAALGKELLESWKLPPSIVEAVAYHHVPSGARGYPTEAAVVHVADVIANATQSGSSGECFVPPLADEAWKSLGLSTSILSPALDHLERHVNDMVRTILKEP
jgi:HD-like signal output (HDOD) protein